MPDFLTMDEFDPDLRGGTIVLLRPYELREKGAPKPSSYYDDMVEDFKRAGVRVVEIGDGDQYLSLEMVEAALNRVQGDAMLLVASHAMDATAQKEHQLYGFNEASYGLDISKLFKVVPDNFHTVLSLACYSGDAHAAAARYLPDGTHYFSMMSGDHVNVLDVSVDQSFSRDVFDGRDAVGTAEYMFFWKQNNIHPSRIKGSQDFVDRYSTRLVDEPNNAHVEKMLGIAQGHLEARRFGFPTKFSIGGCGVFDLSAQMRHKNFRALSQNCVDEFIENYDKLVQCDVSQHPNAGKFYDPNNFSKQEILAHIESGFEALENGTFDVDHPSYVLMHAFAYDYMVNNNICDPVPGVTAVPAGRSAYGFSNN